MKITFIRHANTDYNRDRIYQGSSDAKISNEGLNDLNVMASNFNNKYDSNYCSPLSRTKITAETLMPDVQFTFDDRLKEISLGVFEHTSITEEKENLLLTGYCPLNGESNEEFMIRVKSFMDDLKKEKFKNVVIVTHGGFIRRVMDLLGMEVRELDNLEMLEIEL